MIGHFVGIDVNQLHHPIGIGPAGGSHEVRNRLSANVYWSREHFAGIGEHIGPARGLALVVDQPLRPGEREVVADGLAGARAEGNRLGGVGNVLVKCGVGLRGRGKAQLHSRLQIKPLGRRCFRPRLQLLPQVRAGLVRRHRRHIGLWRVVFQIAIEKRPQHVLPEPGSRVAAKADRTQRRGVLNLLPVVPGAEHQKDLLVVDVERLDCLVDRDRTVDIFLVPQAVNEQNGHLDPFRLEVRGQHLVHRLVAPESVVAGVFENLVPEAHLFQPMLLAQFARRPRGHELVVIVEVRDGPLGLIRTRGFLLPDVGHVLLAEGPVVEPVVAHPAIDHRVHGHRYFQRGVRIHQRHQRQKSVIADAQNAHLAVGLGNVLDQPVDAVIRVSRFIHRRRILRPMNRPVHHVVALRPVLAANVLNHPNVAALDNHIGGIVIAIKDSPQVRARRVAGQLIGAVRCARQQDRRMLYALGHQDHRMQLDPVAHRDHRLAPFVVEVRRGLFEFGRGLAGVVGILRLWCAALGNNACGQRERSNDSKRGSNGKHQADLSWVGKLRLQPIVSDRALKPGNFSPIQPRCPARREKPTKDL